MPVVVSAGLIPGNGHPLPILALVVSRLAVFTTCTHTTTLLRPAVPGCCLVTIICNRCTLLVCVSCPRECLVISSSYHIKTEKRKNSKEQPPFVRLRYPGCVELWSHPSSPRSSGRPHTTVEKHRVPYPSFCVCFSLFFVVCFRFFFSVLVFVFILFCPLLLVRSRSGTMERLADGAGNWRFHYRPCLAFP